MANAPYSYPTPAMLAATIAGNQRLPGTATPLATPMTSSLAAPSIPGGRKLTFRQRLAFLIAGADAGSVLFPPQQPLQPIAQPADMGALGRPWDFPVGWNTRVTPRTGMRIGFRFLKELAEYDIVRIMIERVKDEVTSQDWHIGPRDKKAARDARMDALEDLFAYPDRLHTWRDWLWELLEQVLVYDAPAIWLRPTRGGELYALELMDGALFTPKIMGDGRLPPPEFGPAYQQVIKGLPAVDYVQPVPKGSPIPIDPDGQPFPELLYKPRSPRVDIPYGFSPVEQIIRTLEIGTKREDFLLAYYTAGSVPDMMITAPETWNPDQIAQFHAWFGTVLAGNLENRRGVTVLPGGKWQPYEPKKEALTDATDEWLIRVMCFCFGLSPMPFMKMMNRATGEQHAEQQKEEGLLPYLQWVADLMNHVIAVKFGYRDVVFRWQEEVETDPLQEAQRFQIYLNTKVYHPDEVRVKLGETAMSPDMRDQMDQPTFSQAVNATVLPPDQQEDADARAEQRAQLQPPKPTTGAFGKRAKKKPSRRWIQSAGAY